MEVWAATGNLGKLAEFKQLLNSPELVLHGQGELPVFYPPKEDGKSFTENARIKARALKAVQKGVWVFAEDSGLVVPGLGGLPGIHSARYAGEKASDAENVAKLLKMIAIRSPQNREASFFCSLIAYSPTEQEFEFTGELKGKIATAAKGSAGFGYDPVFCPDGKTETLAELGIAYKNLHSHRAQAVLKFMHDALGLQR